MPAKTPIITNEHAIAHAMQREVLGDAGKLIWDFLTLFADLRYADANNYLASGARMQFPGGLVFFDCTELPRRTSGIYRWVKKRFERIDELEFSDEVIVYNSGTLYGEWLDGQAFDGVRYIDRFVVRDGKIADQQVWNDLCVADAARHARSRNVKDAPPAIRETGRPSHR
jgi:hypothetical protein